MTEFYLAAAAALVTAGIGIGVFIVVCLGIYREERNGSLTQETKSRLDQGVRRLTGAHSRGYRLRDSSGDDSYDEAA
jgi:hypothetical protein